MGNIPVLVLGGDTWHTADNVRRGLAPLTSSGYKWHFPEDGTDWSASRMAEFSMVILAKANVLSATNKNPWLTSDAQAEFKKYLHAGHGLLVIHSGMSGYQNLPEMRGVTGGCFVQHPEQCPVCLIPSGHHPINRGASPFMVQDEQYFMTMDYGRSEIFLKSHSPHGVQPAGWTRVEGAGRVCVLTPGHNVEVWLHPIFQRLLGNALQWTLAHGGATL